MESKSLLVIVNPVAGRGMYRQGLGEALHVLYSAGYKPTVVFTTRAGEAVELAEEGGGRYDALCCLGGDGTLIQAARDTVNRKIPLLGINLGTLGFLAEIEKSGIPDALDSLLLDNYTIEPRMLLEGCVHRRNGGPAQNIALNDIVVNRAGTLRIIDYEISVNGEFLNRYSADGIIVSTPTGSTGYSLSAGGPIISPMASMIVVTPVCPHTLTARSIVLSGGDRVTVHIGSGRRNDKEQAFVTFDGDVLVPVETGDCVDIRRSEKTVNILKISKISFLEVLRNKMRAN